MANLPESSNYPSGIYQIETTDPVVGGPDGISNVQAKQLANRTRWLKDVADEVVTARGGASSLDDRLSAYDAFAPEQQVSLLAGLQDAFNRAALAQREVEVLRRRVLAQGFAVLKYKHVIQGFVLTKSEVRTLHLSQSGTVGSGVSRAQIDGMIVSLSDDDYHVSVPTNETAQDQVYYASLRRGEGGVYGVSIDPQVPDDGLLLYRIDIPANDVGNSLGNVTLSDQRVVQPGSGWVSAFEPFTSVAFPEALPGADYAVVLEVEAASNAAGVGALTAYDKASNGFKIKQTGSADNVRIRWTIINTSYQ